MKLGLKSRSRRVVQDSAVAVADEDAGKIKNSYSDGKNMDENITENYCCWLKLPSELMREVLVKIEASESKWPERKHVVACAGVCKSWRETIREVVKTLENSRKITFPISVKQLYLSELMCQNTWSTWPDELKCKARSSCLFF